MKKGILKRTRETFNELARLLFMTVAATLLFAVLLLLGNLALYTTARITESLFELVRFLFKG